MNMTEKRGQSAMEFLMTYGWAIIVVIVVLSALYFLGVFSPKTVSSCSIQPPFVCNDFIATDSGVTYSVGAKGISSATVTDMIINGQSCVNALNGTISNDGNLNPNQITQVSCGGISLNAKQKVSAEIVIDYTGRAGDLVHTIKGSGTGVTEFSTSHPPTITLTSPSNGQPNVNISVNLTWNGNDLDGDNLTYDVYLNNGLIVDDISEMQYQLQNLNYDRLYNWYIIVSDGKEDPVQSSTWSFTTLSGLSYNGLVFGWNGRIKDDYIRGLQGTLGGDLIAGNIQSGFFDNNATSFDGVNDYINFGDQDALNMHYGNISISAWVYPIKLDDTRILISKGNLATNANQWWLGWTSNKMYFYVNNATALVSGRSTINFDLNANQWSHIVVVAQRDVSNGMKAYVNGVQTGITTTVVSGDILNNINFAIGTRGGVLGKLNWSGTIDELHIWNRSLSSEEVSNLYELYS